MFSQPRKLADSVFYFLSKQLALGIIGCLKKIRGLCSDTFANRYSGADILQAVPTILYHDTKVKYSTLKNFMKRNLI